MNIEFEGNGTRFSALCATQRWCNDHGISYGATTARSPYVGLLIGDYIIAKWHNLTGKERSQLHGYLKVGHPCEPVQLTIKPTYEVLLKGERVND